MLRATGGISTFLGKILNKRLISLLPVPLNIGGQDPGWPIGRMGIPVKQNKVLK